jgi:cytoskeletal protein RodZ
MRWSSLTKFLLGSTLGLVILVAAVLGAGYLLIRQFSAPPPKPIFANDPESVQNSSQPQASTAANPSPPSPTASASPSPSGDYPARVVYPEGLILRDTGSFDANSIGGVDYNQEVTVLETTPDNQWQRIRLASGEEGWVSGGNLERLD